MNAAAPCKSNADCPKVQSGKQGACIDEGEQAAPGDSLYGVCYAPIAPVTNIASCW